MLNLNTIEVKIVRCWSEEAESSPFPQEQAVLRRVKQNPANRGMTFSRKELEVILHWAEKETRGHRGLEQYMLELEAALIEKIKQYLYE